MNRNDDYLDPDPYGRWAKVLRFSPLWVVLFVAFCLLIFVASGIMYVPAKKMAIMIRKNGENLKSGDILALQPDHKGIQLDPISEGFHWKNPFTWDWLIRDQIEVPEGKVGVQVRLYGEPLKEWQVIAEEGQKGILSEVLKPGRYLINPYAIKVMLMDAITVSPGHRGVVWNLSGDMPKKTDRFLVEGNERGVLAKTLESGTYYVNPFVKRVIPVDMRSHRFDTKKADPIRFPSRDGFEIKMDVMIEWAVDPNRMAEVYVKYVDLRGANSEAFNKGLEKASAEQNNGRWSGFFGSNHKPSATNLPSLSSPKVVACIVEKVILPNVRSFTRLEGSNYPAIDFIRGERRIIFQNKFGEELIKNCGREGILIRSALVRNVFPPDEIASPIREREIAIRNAEQYKKEMEREKQEKELAMEKKLQERKEMVTQAKATQDVARVDAHKKQEVALTLAKQKLEVAKKNFEAAKDQAQARVTEGKAKAYVIYQKNKAEAAGLKESSDSFGGGQDYVMYLFNQKIAPSLSYVLSNTDGPFMQIFQKVLEKSKEKDFVPEEGKAKELKIKAEKKKENKTKKP